MCAFTRRSTRSCRRCPAAAPPPPPPPAPPPPPRPPPAPPRHADRCSTHSLYGSRFVSFLLSLFHNLSFFLSCCISFSLSRLLSLLSLPSLSLPTPCHLAPLLLFLPLFLSLFTLASLPPLPLSLFSLSLFLNIFSTPLFCLNLCSLPFFSSLYRVSTRQQLAQSLMK